MQVLVGLLAVFLLLNFTQGIWRLFHLDQAAEQVSKQQHRFLVRRILDPDGSPDDPKKLRFLAGFLAAGQVVIFGGVLIFGFMSPLVKILLEELTGPS
jgi:hypothetical protein